MKKGGKGDEETRAMGAVTLYFPFYCYETRRSKTQRRIEKTKNLR
jgi:hypothetical protein